MRLSGYLSLGAVPLNLDTYTIKRQVFHPLHTQNTLVRQDNHSRYSYSTGEVGSDIEVGCSMAIVKCSWVPVAMSP